MGITIVQKSDLDRPKDNPKIAIVLAGGAVTGGASLAMSSSLSDDCVDDVCPPEREGDLDTATTLAHVATVGFAVGVAGAAVGVVGLLVAGPEEAPDSASLRLRVGIGSLGIAGSF